MTPAYRPGEDLALDIVGVGVGHLPGAVRPEDTHGGEVLGEAASLPSGRAVAPSRRSLMVMRSGSRVAMDTTIGR